MKVLMLIMAVCMSLAAAGCGDDASTSADSTSQVATAEETSPSEPAADGESESDSAPPVETPESIETQSAAEAKKRSEPKDVEVPESPPEELVVKDLILGSGKPVRKGDRLEVRHVAYRMNGKPFELHWRLSFFFNLTPKEVNLGWNEGLPGMRVGGRRELIIPAPLTSRVGVPPSETPQIPLVYVIDLVDLD